MSGNINDDGNEKQRAIFLLKVVRSAIGRALVEDPEVDGLESIERRFGSHMRHAKRYEARTADEALLAIAVLATTYVKNPEAAWAPKVNHGDSVSHALAERLAEVLVTGSVGAE